MTSYKLYLNQEGDTLLAMIKSQGEALLINALLASDMVSKSDMSFYITLVRREILAKRVGVSEITIRKYFTDLVKHKILIRVTKGVYQFNEELLGFDEDE